MSEISATIISPKILRSVLDSIASEDTVIVDCCYNEHEFYRGHVPYAVPRAGNLYVKAGDFCDLGLFYPQKEEFTAMLAEMGIGKESLVIAYDGGKNLYAARFLWGLLVHGINKVRLLNGGWRSWVQQGMPVSFFPHEPMFLRNTEVGDSNHEFIISKEELASKIGDENVKIIDVRSIEEFVGLDPRGNKRGGRIPGSIHLEWTNLLTCDGSGNEICTIKNKSDVEDMLAALNIRPEHTIITYCQRGIRASLVSFVLFAYGYKNVRLYDGSMLEWANNDALPLVRGTKNVTMDKDK